MSQSSAYQSLHSARTIEYGHHGLADLGKDSKDRSCRIDIGVNSNSYAHLRNLTYERSDATRYTKCKDLFLALAFARFKSPKAIRGRVPSQAVEFIHNAHADLGFSRVDLMHFFNGIAFGPGKPWVTTFETALPRWNKSIVPEWTLLNRWAFRALASDRCKRLVALSDNARRIHEDHMEVIPCAKMKRRIKNKITVLHPPQQTLVAAWEEKMLPAEPIRFAIVGHQFFLKGGMEILSVFDQLIEQRHPIELTIVSRLLTDSWCSGSDSSSVEVARRIIAKHPSRITHFDVLKQADVFQLMKESHVALLPSYQESYGYSVLEAQAAACPVISTDQQAFAEINNEECGWTIEVPKDAARRQWNYADYRSPSGRKAVSASIEKGLREAILEIIAQPELIASKGAQALQRIKEFHDPVRHAEALYDIYAKALSA